MHACLYAGANDQLSVCECSCTTGLVCAVSAGSLGGVVVGEYYRGKFHRTQV